MTRDRYPRDDDYDPRLPPDTPRPFVDRDLAELVRLSSKLGMYYREGDKRDDSSMKKWIVGVGIGITVAFTAAFIAGGWTLSNQVSSLTATVVARFNEQDRRFSEQNERISNLEKRTQRGYQDERP